MSSLQNFKINFFSTKPVTDDVRRLEDRLRSFGKLESHVTRTIAQFTLATDAARDEVERAVHALALNGEIQINLTENLDDNSDEFAA